MHREQRDRTALLDHRDIEQCRHRAGLEGGARGLGARIGPHVLDHDGPATADIGGEAAAEIVEPVPPRVAVDGAVGPFVLDQHERAACVDLGIERLVRAELAAQRLGGGDQDVVWRRKQPQAALEFQQESEPALEQHLFRGLGAGTEQAQHRAPCVAHRCVAEGEMRLLRAAAAIQTQRDIVHMHRLAGPDPLDQRREFRLDLGPHVEEWRAECRRMPAAEQCRVRLVVEHDTGSTPGDEHGLARRQHHAHQGAQRLRPRIARAERSRFPGMGFEHPVEGSGSALRQVRTRALLSHVPRSRRGGPDASA